MYEIKDYKPVSARKLSFLQLKIVIMMIVVKKIAEINPHRKCILMTKP